jgi:myo-inositol-1(or 4)-monophosphatase
MCRQPRARRQSDAWFRSNVYSAAMGPSGAAGCRLTDAEVAVAAARAGAAVVREAYGSAPQQIGGSRLDVTTEADLASQRAVLSMLAAHRADDAREGEETGLSGHAAARRRWLVDPLCGTANFAATTPLMSVNVALTQAGAVIAAASVDPITAEVFWTDGEGAWLRTNGHDSVLTPSASSRLVEINCDGPLSVPFVGGQLLADQGLRTRWAPRVVSTTLAAAWVAAGRRAAYITDGNLEGWVHFSSGIALCRAAGCIVTDLAGGPLHAGRGLIAAPDVSTHEEMVEVVRPHLEAAAQSEDSAAASPRRETPSPMMCARPEARCHP